MFEQPDFIYSVAAMLTFATVAIGVFGILLTRVFVLVLKVPREYLMPLVFALCVIGPYALTQRPFEIVVMVFFGLAGYLLRKMHYPVAPLVLGIILGELLDKSLRRSLILSDGDLTPFFTRPISAGFAFVIGVSVILSLRPVRQALMGLIDRWTGKRANKAEG